MSGVPTRAPLPAFAESFPDDPALETLVDAFARGDYARVRREAPKLEAATANGEVKRAARALVARTQADPLAIWLFGLTALLLVALTAWWWRYNGPAPSGIRSSVVEHVR